MSLSRRATKGDDGEKVDAVVLLSPCLSPGVTAAVPVTLEEDWIRGFFRAVLPGVTFGTFCTDRLEDGVPGLGFLSRINDEGSE